MSKSYIPSNGTEGMIFRENFCDQCERDREWNETHDPENACPIATATMAYAPGDPEYPPEWIYADDNDIFSGTCTAYEPYTEPGDLITRPKCKFTLDLFEGIINAA